MKTARIPLLLCALLATTTTFAEDAKEADSPDTLIATVNEVPYPLDVFRIFYMERLQGNQAQQNNPAFQQQVFDEFMGLIVASQEGDRRKLEDNRNVVAALQLERMKVMSNAALSAMADEIEPTEDELKETYEKVKEKTTRMEYKARHILVKEEDEAKKLIKQLDKGKDFAELAKEHSEGPTGKDGGELGWFDAKQMVAPFSEAVAALKPGSYTKEPVKTQFGWHVIELEDSRTAEPPAFEDAKPQLIALVKRQKIAEKVNEMRNGAMVELNEDVVKMKEQDQDAKSE
ncbi:peptidylprolyl isomerase [Thiorhodococcus mannitoliphagus]|uniref:peptidylprolyl isomerase n=1 Tax=Thiorhodococcus mannitoliphagus TaxID=329406 RepID=A0A6P1DST6_9GAMM|nr:peptidylprolyl isomerase [Thiorhodococcus mannitoliphagus]NEX20001.1 peptidylprolyl isomerase [Thiorhodococcus mannitoliphagus]